MSSPSPNDQLTGKRADSHELRALTGIRGVAAVWVVLYHFYPAWLLLVPGLAFLRLPISRGHFGVDLFFMLSGFILCYVYDSSSSQAFGPREYGKFIWYRVARIFPNHLAALSVLVLLVLGAQAFHVPIEKRNFSHLPYHFTLTQEWPFAPPGQAAEWVSASWSLSAEWFAYLFIFPMVAFILRRKWKPGPSLVVAYALLSFLLFGFGEILPYLPFDYNLLEAICEFAAGGLFFGAYRSGGTVAALSRQAAGGLAMALLVCICFVALSDRQIGAIFVLLTPILLVGLTSEVSWPGWLLSIPFSLWLGRISYALYITHTVTERILKSLLPWDHYKESSLSVRILVLTANVFAIFTFALCVHYLVEIP